jgi:NADH dehydrogenase FAD-containing subunit
MLPEIAASDLELNTIINPLRKLLKRVNTFVGKVEAIDLDDRLVAIAHGADEHLHQLPFDYLILALGSNTNFFGLPRIESSALSVKTIDDGVAIRNQVITQLEEADSDWHAHLWSFGTLKGAAKAVWIRTQPDCNSRKKSSWHQHVIIASGYPMNLDLICTDGT